MPRILVLITIVVLLAGWPLALLAHQGDGITVKVCEALGCGHQAGVRFDAALLARLDGLFSPATENALEERRRIRAAIALLEGQAGAQSLIHLDRGRNPDSDGALEAGGAWPLAVNQVSHPDVRGQLDCVAEARNTTRFLRLLAARSLLHFHRVLEPAFRAPKIFDQHWSAQIEVFADGRRYVVDSWFLDNGKPPYIQGLQAWLGKHDLPASGVE